MQPFIVGGIANHHPEQVIGVTAHQVAFHDLGTFPDPYFKFRQLFLGLFLDGNLDKNIVRQSGGGLLNQSDVAIYHPVIFQ